MTVPLQTTADSAYVEMEEGDVDLELNVIGRLSHNNGQCKEMSVRDGSIHNKREGGNKPSRSPNPTGWELFLHCCGTIETWMYRIEVLIAVALLYGPFIAQVVVIFIFEDARERYLEDLEEEDDNQLLACDLFRRMELYLRVLEIYVFMMVFKMCFRGCMTLWFDVPMLVFHCAAFVLGFYATVWIPVDAACPTIYPEYFAAARTTFRCTSVCFLFGFLLYMKDPKMSKASTANNAHLQAEDTASRIETNTASESEVTQHLLTRFVQRVLLLYLQIRREQKEAESFG